MAENIFQIMDLMAKKGISRKDLAALTGYGSSMISDVLNGKANPSKRFLQLATQALESNTGTVINGDNHEIKISHVAEQSSHYSPVVDALVDVVKEWDERKTKRLLRQALEMDEENGG